MQYVLENKKTIGVVVAVLVLICLAYFSFELRPVGPAMAESKTFQVGAGDGFRNIANRLEVNGIIRSATAFKFLAVLMGGADKLKPGTYELNPALGCGDILLQLVLGSRREVTVVIPEGSSIYEIDKILSDANVIKIKSLVNTTSSKEIEGKLFPDTYNFFTNSGLDEVVNKFTENFNNKALPLLSGKKSQDAKRILIIASLLEKEVPQPEDQRIVAGILQKRLNAGMPLQVDATICYIKQIFAYPKDSACYPLTPLDFHNDSAYNTYIHTGLPPTPIGNPGISAINAAINSKSSPYWYYLSDPKTKKTVFAETLDEQAMNRARYLGI